MAVYSKIILDDEIINVVKVHNAQKVFIVCCNGCANESLAYANKVPIFRSPSEMSLSEAFKCGREVPYASLNEAQRIKALLEQINVTVEFAVSRANEIFCIRNANEPFSIYDVLSEFDPDIILSLSCPAGVCGLHDELQTGNNTIPVICLMRPLGQISYVFTDSEMERIMIYDDVKICYNK